MSEEKPKYERVNRFLFKCGVLWRDEFVENPPNLDVIMERMQDEITHDTVEAIIAFDKLGIIRKLNAISAAVGLSVEELPQVKNRATDYIKHVETMNVWDYIVRISRRDDWIDYTIKGYEQLTKEKETKDVEGTER